MDSIKVLNKDLRMTSSALSWNEGRSTNHEKNIRVAKIKDCGKLTVALLCLIVYFDLKCSLKWYKLIKFTILQAKFWFY